jgi:hypothetical protein
MKIAPILCSFLDGKKCKVAELTVSHGVCLDCLAKDLKGTHLKPKAKLDGFDPLQHALEQSRIAGTKRTGGCNGDC